MTRYKHKMTDGSIAGSIESACASSHGMKETSKGHAQHTSLQAADIFSRHM
jgi:hypothetical protein